MLTEGIHTAEFLLSEANGSLSREQVTVIAGPAMVSGTVVSQLTADGTWAPYDDAGTDGTEAAKGILYTELAASAATRKAVVFVRQAEVAAARLTGYNANAKTDLAAAGIIVR